MQYMVLSIALDRISIHSVGCLKLNPEVVLVIHLGAQFFWVALK